MDLASILLLSLSPSAVPLQVLFSPLRDRKDWMWRLTAAIQGSGRRMVPGASAPTQVKPQSARPCFTGAPWAESVSPLFSKYIFLRFHQRHCIDLKKYIQSFTGITAETEVIGMVWFVDFLFVFVLFRLCI